MPDGQGWTTSTTGNMEQASGIVILQLIKTEEHNTPSLNLTRPMKLPQGKKYATVPKLGTMAFGDLHEGEDIVDAETIQITTHDIFAHEFGGKVVFTDELVEEQQHSVWEMVGDNMGKANARLKEQKVIATWPNLNNGVAFGGADATMSIDNYSAAMANAQGKTPPFRPSYSVQHPHAVYALKKSMSATVSNQFWPSEFTKKFLEGAWSPETFYSGVTSFQTALIPIDGDGDAIGVLAEKDALVNLTQRATRVEKQRDASLRGWEVVMTTRTGIYVLDNDKGVPLIFDATAPAMDA